MESKKGLKLDIGCGRMPHRGYKTIDVEEYANPDYLGDFREMSFEDVEEIRSHHLLEHFGREEGEKVLKLWHSWLRQGGKLIVETPDFEEIGKDFSIDPYWMTRHAFGSQESDWAYHRDGWYEAKFREVLPRLGFEIISIGKSKSRKILPNVTVIAKKQ